MLQASMVAKTDANATGAATPYRRAAFVLGLVLAMHVVALGWATLSAERTREPVERALSSRTIVATLLKPDAALAASSASAVPEPAIAPPVARREADARLDSVRRENNGHARAHANALARTPRVRAMPGTPATTAPTAMAAQSLPNERAASPPSRAPALDATPEATAPAAPPAVEPTPSTSAPPKRVSHVDCTIPRPDYPDMSKRRGENGTAVVRFVVGLAGRVEAIDLQKSSGYERLDDAALAAVRASVCAPYSEHGRPVRAAYSQSFVFGLTE